MSCLSFFQNRISLLVGSWGLNSSLAAVSHVTLGKGLNLSETMSSSLYGDGHVRFSVFSEWSKRDDIWESALYKKKHRKDKSRALLVKWEGSQSPPFASPVCPGAQLYCMEHCSSETLILKPRGSF